MCDVVVVLLVVSFHAITATNATVPLIRDTIIILIHRQPNFL